MDEGVTIDIGKHPESRSGVDKDENGYYYDSSSGGKVLVTEEWFPDLEGTYRRFTHTPEKGQKISKINNGGTPQNGFGTLTTYTSVSVFYWGQDYQFQNPLLIQLGEGMNEYYTWNNNDTWTKQGSITADILKSKLDGQNCERNQAHTFNISERNGYQCPNCTGTSILIIPQHEDNYDYYAHYILAPSNSSFSTTSFKDDKTYQIGLPTTEDLKGISVYWTKSSGKPLLIHYEQEEDEYGWQWFRRNKENSNTWSEVGKTDQNLPGYTSDDSKIKHLLGLQNYYPLITPDLFMPADAQYPDGNMSINITVRNAPLGNGYWKYKHSLRGGLFKLKGVEHNGNVLDGITPPDYILDSVTAFYLGNDPGKKEKLIMVELEKNNGGQDKYEYYIRKESNQNSWTTLRRQGETGKLENDELITQLSQLKAQEDKAIAYHQKQVTINAVGGTVGGIVAAGALVAIVKTFWPAIVASFSAL